MAVDKSELTNVRSSIVFEMFLRINFVCLFIWILIESISFIYKNQIIIYPSQGQIAGEIILMIAVFFFDILRLTLASISNRTESILLCVLTILVTIAVFFGYLYFVQWQLFVIRAELIITIISLVCTGSGIIFLILCIIFFARPAPIPTLYRQMPYRATM